MQYVFLKLVFDFQAAERVNLSLKLVENPNSISTFTRLSDVSKAVCENGGVLQTNPLSL